MHAGRVPPAIPGVPRPQKGANMEKQKGLLIGLGLGPKQDGGDEEESEESSSKTAFKEVAQMIKDDESVDEIASALKDAVEVCVNEYKSED